MKYPFRPGEAELLCAIADGKTTRAQLRDLNIQVSTIDRYMGMLRDAELVAITRHASFSIYALTAKGNAQLAEARAVHERETRRLAAGGRKGGREYGDVAVLQPDVAATNKLLRARW